MILATGPAWRGMTPIAFGIAAGVVVLTPAHQHTEASTWVTATHHVGTSLGTASAGWAVVHLSLNTPFVASAIFLVIGATIAYWRQADRN